MLFSALIQSIDRSASNSDGRIPETPWGQTGEKKKSSRKSYSFKKDISKKRENIFLNMRIFLMLIHLALIIAT